MSCAIKCFLLCISDNVSHDYISHVISQVDHNMVLVTRRPTNAEAHYVSEIAKDSMLSYSLQLHIFL